ncbi:MAG: GTPase ObgE, partial [Akkermansia sp.]|nr:GTPase ObgE [Akkermansia sp.]
LRHIMRCQVLLFVVDMTGLEHDPIEAIQTLRKEIKLYSEELAERDWIILANKMDDPTAVENLEILRQRFPKVEILPISAAMGDGIPALKERLKNMLKK